MGLLGKLKLAATPRPGRRPPCSPRQVPCSSRRCSRSA